MPRRLPLSRFNVLSTDCPDTALESVRLRQPGTRTIDAPSSPSWHLVSNAVLLGPVTLLASGSGGYRIDVEEDRLVRFFAPLHGDMAQVKRGEAVELGRAEAFLFSTSRGHMLFRPESRLLLLSAGADATAEAMRLLDCDVDPVLLADRFAAAPHLPGLVPLRRAVTATIREIDEAPPRLMRLERFRRAHAELLLLHLADVLAGAAGRHAERDRPRSRVLRRAIDYIEATPVDAFSYAGVAEAAGTSLRTVQLAFRREVDTTIGAWVQQRRLARARKLLRAGPPGLTVTEAAELAGWFHPGRFASAYRAAFGENPSDTMRRRRD